MAEYGDALSQRELEVLRQLPSGASNKEIAEALSISPYTVKTHLRNIFAKLGVSSRAEAVTVAVQQGMVIVAPPVGGAAIVDRPIAVDVPEPEIVTSEQMTGEADIVPSGRRWAWPAAVAGLVLLLLIVLLALLWQQRGLATAGEPFEEKTIADSRWLSSRPLPEPRVSQAVAGVGLDIFHIGGETDAGVVDSGWRFDTVERRWHQIADKPTAVSDTTAAELFGEVYVPGGRLSDGNPTDIVEAYSPSQNAWRRLASLPQPVTGGLAIADGGFLYLIGGLNGNDILDTVYVYDPAADSWRPVAPMPEPVGSAAGAAVTGHLYVVGGYDGRETLSTCQVYRPSDDVWDSCPSLLQPRTGAGATVLLNKLYVVGGGQDTGAGSIHGEVFDPNSETWQVLDMPQVTAAWEFPGVTHVENRLFAQGGRHGELLSDANLVYSPFVYQTFIPAASSDTEE